MREKLIEVLDVIESCNAKYCCDCEFAKDVEGCVRRKKEIIADHLISNGVTVQECAYWQYIDDDIDEDNNIQAYCSACGAGDKHTTSMIGKVPYCWKCGRKMMLQLPKGE